MKTLLLTLLLVPMMSFGQRAGNSDIGEVIYLFDLPDGWGEIKVYSSHHGAYQGSSSSFTIKMGDVNPLVSCYNIDNDIILNGFTENYYDDEGNAYEKSTEDITTSFDDDWTVELVGGYYIATYQFSLYEEAAATYLDYFFSFHIEKSSGDLRKISFTSNNRISTIKDCLSGTFSDAYVLVTERKRY